MDDDKKNLNPAPPPESVEAPKADGDDLDNELSDLGNIDHLLPPEEKEGPEGPGYDMRYDIHDFKGERPDIDHDEEIPLYAIGERFSIGRGDELDLGEKDPTLRKAMVGLGWDLKGFESDPPDLDASVFLLDKNEKTRVDEDFIFYNNLTSGDGAVKHLGDSRTGAGDGDDENVMIDLTALPFEIMKIVFTVSIYPKSDFETETFDMVRNVFFRLMNEESKREVFYYELDEALGNETGLIIGQLERVGPKWIFTAIGEPVEGGLSTIADSYGIVVAERVLA